MITKNQHGIPILEIDGFRFALHRDSDHMAKLFAWWDGTPMLEYAIKRNLKIAKENGSLDWVLGK